MNLFAPTTTPPLPVPRVRHPGQALASAPRRQVMRPGGVLRLPVRAGEWICWRNEEGAAALCLLGFDVQGAPASMLAPHPGLHTTTLSPSRFDLAPLRAWAGLEQTDPLPLEGLECGRAMVGLGAAESAAASASAPASAEERQSAHHLAIEEHTLSIVHTGHLWCLLPITPAASPIGGGGCLTLAHHRASDAPALPEPLAATWQDIPVPPAQARAYRVRAGELIQVIDVQGQQCSDFLAFRADALALGQERFIDSTVTRTLVGAAYPGPGLGLADKFFDQDMHPLLAVVQDTVGRHDTFALACTARGYEERGFPGHANCSDNISQALAPFGVAPRRAWPAVNFFFNSWILPGDNRLRSDTCWSQAGDYVLMRALTDLVCVSTACPDDTSPINNWNPTDIHVRLYPETAQIAVAHAYRPSAEMLATLTEPSAFHARTSALTRHYAAARDQWLPVSYEATRALEEARACREAVTLQDLSSLRKYDIAGPDAQALLDLATTRDVRRLSVHRGQYTLVCDEAGSVIDDGTLWRLAPDVFRWCPSSEASALHLRELAAARGLQAFVRGHERSLPNLALQGPRSRELLSALVFTQPNMPALHSLKWFGFTVARLRDRDGPAFMLTRSGYTGELGYEIFCDRADALTIWDALTEAGADLGLKPMGSEALGLMRVEAGLAAQGAEFGGDIDAFEAGLGFAVDLAKPDFIGRAALARIQAAPRRVLTGLLLSGDEVPAHGDGVFLGRQRVGTVTSAVRSPALGHAIALARVAAEWAAPGHTLEVGRLDGQMRRLPCTTAATPFVDPQRLRARA